MPDVTVVLDDEVGAACQGISVRWCPDTLRSTERDEVIA